MAERAELDFYMIFDMDTFSMFGTKMTLHLLLHFNTKGSDALCIAHICSNSNIDSLLSKR